MGDTGATNAFTMRFLIGAISLKDLCPGSLDDFYEPVVQSLYACLDGKHPFGRGSPGNGRGHGPRGQVVKGGMDP